MFLPSVGLYNGSNAVLLLHSDCKDLLHRFLVITAVEFKALFEAGKGLELQSESPYNCDWDQPEVQLFNR